MKKKKKKEIKTYCFFYVVLNLCIAFSELGSGFMCDNRDITEVYYRVKDLIQRGADLLYDLPALCPLPGWSSHSCDWGKATLGALSKQVPSCHCLSLACSSPVSLGTQRLKVKSRQYTNLWELCSQIQETPCSFAHEGSSKNSWVMRLNTPPSLFSSSKLSSIILEHSTNQKLPIPVLSLVECLQWDL